VTEGVFISHVAEDAEIALRLALALEENGHRTWCYEIDSVPGPSYLVQVSEAIGRAEVVVIVISAPALASRQVTRELVRALEAGKHFIPILHNLSHEEFQSRQPEWNQVLGAATSIRIPPRGIDGVVPRLLEGLKALDVESGLPARWHRLDAIQAALPQSQGTGESVPRTLPAPAPVSRPARRPLRYGGALLSFGLIVLVGWSILNRVGWSILNRVNIGPSDRQGLVPDSAPGQPIAVGVMEIRARGTVPDWMRDVTRDAFNTILSKAPGVEVYSKQKIDFLRAKRGLTEIEAAEELRIRRMVAGTVSMDATVLVLEIEVIDTTTGVLKDSERTSGPPDQLIEIQNRAAMKLIRALEVKMSAEQLEKIFANRTNDTLDSYRMLAETMGDAATAEPRQSDPSNPSREKGTSRWFGPRPAFAGEITADEQAVRSLLERYQTALERKDVDHLATLQVSMDDEQRAALARYFSNARNLKVRFGDLDLIIEGEDALATFTRTDSFEDARNGKEVKLELRINSQLTKEGGTWKIRGLKKPS
jgi:TolB-like protein